MAVKKAKKKIASDYFGPGTGREKMSGKQASLIRSLLKGSKGYAAKKGKWI